MAVTTSGTAAGLVDWRTVERLTALVPAGPSASRSTRASSVAVLRRSAQEAPGWVARITGLNRAAQQVADEARVSVVDRAGLMRTSAGALRGLMEQVPAPGASETARLVGAAEVAGAMSVLATRLLGQVVPAAPSGADGDVLGTGRPDGGLLGGGRSGLGRPVLGRSGDGRPGGLRPGGEQSGAVPRGAVAPHILLVAPNVLAVRRQMDLDMLDLPAWVCLHETTHAVQLTAAPWLGPYLTDSMLTVISTVVDAVYGAPGGDRDGYGRFGDRGGGGGSGHRGAPGRGGTGGAGGPTGSGVGDRASGSRSRPRRALRIAARAGRGRVLEGLTNLRGSSEVASLAAALTFLEGHAEVVLDDVRPNRMPSVHRLRAVLTRSRAADGGVGPGPGLGALLLHRLMGLEAKEAQYADGAAFVRSVVARIGHEGLNVVWSDPALLPTPDEIARPDAWLRRVS